MPKRNSKWDIRAIIEARRDKEEWSELDVSIGHPCGFIAYAMWLACHPKASIKVSKYLTGDAYGLGFWNQCSFADMVYQMAEAGCLLHKNAVALVVWYERAGKPQPWTWPENRVYLKVEGLWLNTTFEEMPLFLAFHRRHGGTCEMWGPKDAAERAYIESLPVVRYEEEETSIPF